MSAKNICTVCIVLIITSMTSCGGLKNLTVGEIHSVHIASLKGSKAVIEVIVEVSNPSPHNLYVKNADFEILRDEYLFGDANLHHRVKIDKHSSGEIPIKFNINITDRMAILSGRIKALFSGDDRSKLYLSGYLKCGTKMMSKKIRLNNYQLTANE